MAENSFFKHISVVLLQMVSGKLLVFLWFFLVMVSAVINVYLAQDHAEKIAQERAGTMFDQILLIRKWNARHGGVYVPITEYTKPNPYLKIPDRDATTNDGKKLTMINPAFMTRQLSELATESKVVQFNITSLNPIRPENAPIKWERAALESFEKGEKEVGQFLYKEGMYRYMAPLFTTMECLKCHIDQGYKVGDIRGGISITQSVREILHSRNMIFFVIFISHIVVLLIGCAAFVLYERGKRQLEQFNVDKESAKQANDFKRSFIANISHELRTPLNAIIGMSYILSESGLDIRQRENVKKISEAGNRLNTMINQMLDFSRIDNGTLEINLAPIQFRQLVKGSIELMREQAAKKGLLLETEFEEGLPEWVLGDAKHIRQILFYIIDNAIKFTEKGQIRINVSSRPEKDKLQRLSIMIKDTGIGMKILPEWLEQHDFSQLDDFSTRSQGGVGIGLTMTRRLLDLMGGDIQIESQEGVGTSATINLKLKRPDSEASIGEEYEGKAQYSGGVTTEKSRVDLPEAQQKILSVSERQQLNKQLGEVRAALESDLYRAMGLLEEMVKQYQGSDFQKDLESLSEMMKNFDSDGILSLAKSIQGRLLLRER